MRRPAIVFLCEAARASDHVGLGEVRVATLHLMVGLPCSGKTTLARKLEREKSALRLTTDEWHIRLFGQDAEDPAHNARHTLIEALLWTVARRALELGTNVILDFGFWAREEREDYRAQAKAVGASSEVHFLDVPADELMRRLRERNAQASPASFYIPEDMMQPWIVFFQRPTPDELKRRE
jgi:predicted kinase